MNEKKILIADTAFISEEIKKKYHLINVFPMREGDGAFRASLDELLERSKMQSSFYEDVLPQLTLVMNKYMASAGSEAQHLIRTALVKTTSIFVDRSLRLIHRIKQSHPEELSFVEIKLIPTIQWQSDFDESWRINQDVIQRIMTALNFKGIKVFELKDYPEFPRDYAQKNLLFRPQKTGIKGLIVKVLWQFFYYLDSISNKRSRFQSLGFGADRFYLAKRGMLGPFGFFHANLKNDLVTEIKDQKLRDQIFEEVSLVLNETFKNLMLKLDSQITPDVLEKLTLQYSRTFMDWFPVGFLEGLEINLLNIKKALDLDQIKAVIGHNTVSDIGYYVSTIARLNGIIIIGVQHGGHYGYVEDLSNAGQSEYVFNDLMLTWGWTEFDSHLPKCQVIVLPSPKLSEKPLKSDYIRSNHLYLPETRDILFFSNLFHRFPHISTCGQSRVDFIDEITCSQEKLVQEVGAAGLTLNHKPFSMRFIDLYPEHFKRLELAGGENYQLLNSSHKGISEDFIKTCRIVLWDQIGSGALECFTSGVPAIIYWPRIYSREAQSAKKLIMALESVGVVHTNPRELTKEIKTYLADPPSWMENTERKQAIENFCKIFALTDPHWYKQWKMQLKKWS
ncbi:MAG: hypothetical protein PHY93_14015 [Bacteriovorax sp.]|nr:hypothetical protein [Bacteriovorax sp.]